MANVGTIDRVLRLVVGGALIAAPFAADMPIFENDMYKYGAIAVGVVLIATAAMKFCPIYRIFGLRTCKV